MCGKRMVGVVGAGVASLALAGCFVHTTRSSDGDKDDVDVRTPLGGLQVHSGADGHSVDTGLPVFPHARPEHDKGDDSGSVDLHMGFGPWQMRVQVATYATDASEAQVQSFYAQALGSYGAVLVCRNGEPTTAVTHTGEGLTCRDGAGSNSHVQLDDKDLELKAGSKLHQHIAAIGQKNGATEFALVALQLPRGTENGGDAE